MRISYYLIIITLIISGCAPSRFVVPLQEKQHAISFSLGGPLMKNFGPPIPIPITTLAFGHGFKEDLTLYGAIHPTAIAFKTMQFELGGLKNWINNDGYIPGVSTSLTANFALGMREGGFRFWPQVDINAYWLYGKNRSFCYTGLGNWFELSGTRAHGEQQPKRWLPNIFIGNTFARQKMNYTIEMKYLLPGVESDKTVAEYIGIGGKGATGIYFSVTRKL